MGGPQPAPVPGQAPDAGFCERCGQPAATGEHGPCETARRLEPPRYCATCGRRMVVQVTPVGWTATCSTHGTSSGSVGARP